MGGLRREGTLQQQQALLREPGLAGLLRRGWIAPTDVVDGSLLVTDVSRRNVSLKILRDREPSLFLKQAADREGKAAVAREVAVYRLLHARGPAGIRGLLPRVLEADAPRGTLLLELVAGARSLRDEHAARRRVPVRVAAAVGQALANLHRCGLEARRARRASPEPGPPWVLSLHRPPLEALGGLSAANQQLVALLQGARELRDGLDDLSRGWEPRAFVHNDARWDNWLVLPGRAGRASDRLRLVDWEAAGPGDPGWDVGTVLGEFLSTWLLSVPAAGGSPPKPLPELAAFPLSTLQPAIRAFWQAYASRMELEADGSVRGLLQGARWAAPRLVQTAYEQMQASERLAAGAVSLIQLAHNLLREPQKAVVQLLGIPLQTGARPTAAGRAA